MKKLLVKILTLVLAFTSLFALSLFTGCDCGDNGGNGGVVPKPEEQVEKYLNLDVAELNLIVGDEHKLVASYKKEEGKTLTFESADANVATVGAKGEILAYNEGSTTITAKYGDLTATCKINVTFGDYLPELTFEGGELDVYNIGLDGIPYTFSPVIKFNGKIFTDAEVSFASANEGIAKFENADVKGISLGETTATVTASWRGFEVADVPALQKVVKIKTHNVVNFLINEQTYEVMKLSTFNGEFEGETYSNSSDFKVKLVYNGEVKEGAVKVDVKDSTKVAISNETITAKAMGKTDITLSYTDSTNQYYSTDVTVEVIRPVADSGKKFTYFSAQLGYYKDIFADFENKSVIKEVLGADASKVTDAYVLDGAELKVEGDKILNAPVIRESSLLNTIVIGTATYAYSCEIDTYGVVVADKEDLALFDVHFTNAEETEYSYVDGYCELVRDIDATGFKPKHTAVHTVNAKVNMYNEYGKYYVGFRGIFNGKGFTIFNLDTTRDSITYVNKNGNKQVDDNSVGLFGYLAGPAIIKNVAFENMKVVKGNGLVYQGLCSVVDTTTTVKGNCSFENIYISLSEDSKEPRGILFFQVPGSRFNLTNVVINAPNLEVGDEESGGLIDNNGTGLEKDDRATYDGVIVISKYPLGFFSYYTMYGGNEKTGRDMYSEDRNGTVDLTQYALDTKLGYTPGPNGEKLLYRRKSAIKKYNNISEMAADTNNFSKFPDAFWKIEKDENGGQTIFWKSLLGYSYDLYNEDGEIFDSVLFDTEGAKPYKFTIKNSIEPITDYTATVSDSNVLEVKNGAIYLKQYKIGYYEVTLQFTSKFNTPITRVIPVTVDAKHIATYLQQDGEIVNHGMSSLPAGASFSINGVNVPHTFEGGKLKVDLTNVDMSEVKLASTVDVYMKTSSGYDSRFVSMYVTLAIDEAEELNYFNVGYTFNQAEYDALTFDAEKIAYLEKCEAEPFKYFDGYYVLAKDIDATGIKFGHEAAIETATQQIKYDANGDGDVTDGKDYYNFVKGDAGFLVNEATNTLEPRNANAPIVGPNGKEYMIPRDGYPIVGMYTGVTENATSANGVVYSGSFGVPVIYFKKIGFMGTFDGQGHIISNLNTSRYETADVKYYNSNEDVNAQVVASKKGAGLFGIINNGCKVMNVAFTDVEFNWSALLAMYGNTPHAGALNTNNVEDILTIAKYQLENVYISAAKNTGKVLSFTTASSGAMLGSFKDVIVDMTGAKEQYLLNPGHFTQTNSSLYAKMERVYIASTFDVPSKLISQHEGNLYFGSSMADLYANTDILDKFAGNPYFEVLARGTSVGVFYKGTYASTLSVSSDGKQVEKITLDKETLSKELVIEDGFGVADDAVIEISNTNVLEYANGVIKVKDGAYAQGDYEVTIKVTAEDELGNPTTLTKTIKVILAPDVITGGYLQTVDGEIVGSDLTSIDGLTFSIDEADAPATLEGGKLKLDLTNVDLSNVEYLEYVDVYVANANGDDVILRVQKVSLAIDEAEDLYYFSADLVYDEAYYNSLTTDDARHEYLAACQASPIKYFDGYYVLTKDIDATGIKLAHTAAKTLHVGGNALSNNKGVGSNPIKYDDNTNTWMTIDGADDNIKAVSITVPATGNYAETTYLFPRTGAFGEGTATWLANITGSANVKAGLMGTFDGQGYTISNLDTTKVVESNGYMINNYSTAGRSVTGAGLFGIIKQGATVKNLALTNVNMQDSVALANILISPSSDNAKAANFENIYISASESTSRIYGTIYNAGSWGPNLKNIVIDIHGVVEGKPITYTSDNSFCHTNPGLRANYEGVYIASSLAFTRIIQSDTEGYKFDITLLPTMAELFNATTNIGGYEYNMATTFADNEYFDVISRGTTKAIYWHGTYKADSYEPSFKLVDEDGDEISKVSIAPGTTEAEVKVVDLFGTASASDVTVEFVGNAGDYLEYANGKIIVKNHEVATYEVSFKTIVKVGEEETEYTKVLQVQLLPNTVEGGYLQQDGEVYNHGLTSIEGATFSINDIEVPATLTSGKLVLDLSNADLSNVKDKDIVNVYMDNATAPDVNFALTYVLAIIDEASDLTKFNVGYTYDQAEFDALTSDTDKKAYLEYCQANPYDYYEGTILLVKDIDATGITFNHEAIFNVNDNTNVGFTINEVGNTLTAVNANAPIVFDGVTYNIPRAGYPALRQQSTSNSGKTFVPGAFFYKMGFYGTFDGQGYTISNLAPARNTTVQYYVGETATNYTGYGAGIFGTVSANSEIKNVAITNYNGEKGPVFALVDISPVKLGTETYHYDANDVFAVMGKSDRTLFENIYVENTSTTATATMFRYTAGGRGAKLNNIYIDALTVISKQSAFGGYSEQALITGGNTFSQGNGSLCHQITNVYVLTTMAPNLTSTSYAHLDIVYAKSLTELFSATTTTTGKTKDIMGVAFADNEYFDVVSRGTGKGVYWHGTYTETEYEGTLSFVDGEGNPVDSVVIKYGETEADLLVKDLFGTASASDITATVDNNGTGIIKYEDGKVKVVNYSAGYYELTLKVTVTAGETSKDYSKTVSVQLLPESKTAYLSQVDGEIVDLDLGSTEIEALDGAVATVNSLNTSSLNVEGGKLYLDMTTAGLSNDVLTGASEVVVSTKDYSLVLTYVTKAINEGSDLSFFSVDYTYNDADYEAAIDKGSYLAACQAKPFDYFDGYYVLTKDIDASGVELKHEAVIPTGTSSTGIGVIANENTNTYEAVHPDAGISYGGTNYVFPRPGYPLVGMKYVADWSTGVVTEVKGFPLVLFANIGLTGTFDGQGYTISNLTTSRTTPVAYKVSGAEEKTILEGSGLFGIVRNLAVIKNVGLTINADNGASGIALYAITPYKAKTWTVSATDSTDLPDATAFNVDVTSSMNSRLYIENVYIEDLGAGNYSTRPNGLIFNNWYNESRPAFKNVLVNAPLLRMNYGIFNAVKFFYGTVPARDVKAENLFIVGYNNGSESGFTTSGNNYFDLTFSTTIEALWDGTITQNMWTAAVKESSIYELSETAPDYWLAMDSNSDGINDKLYYKTLAPSAE